MVRTSDVNITDSKIDFCVQALACPYKSRDSGNTRHPEDGQVCYVLQSFHFTKGESSLAMVRHQGCITTDVSISYWIMGVDKNDASQGGGKVMCPLVYERMCRS